MRALTFARLGALAAVAMLALFAGIAYGGVTIAPDRLAAVLLQRTHDDPFAAIVWTLRLPRVAAGAMVGAALGVAGALMQALLRNPLVDPYLTGISAGAGVAVAIGTVLGLSAAVTAPLGFFAGAATALAVAALARRGAGIDRERLILAGVVLSSLLAAVVTVALMTIARDYTAEMLLAWLAGSLAGRGPGDVLAALPEFAAGLVLAVIAVPALNVVRVGEARAAALGVDVGRLQWTLLAAATLLTASAVVLGGLVGFVGLLVPHLARRVVGDDLRALLPAAFLIGAALVALADTIARTVLAPAEIPLGVLLAFVGVPAFFVLYLRGGTRAYV